MMDYWSTTGQLPPAAIDPYRQAMSVQDFQSLGYQASGYSVPTGGESYGDGSLGWADWTARSWDDATWATERDAIWRSEQGWHW